MVVVMHQPKKQVPVHDVATAVRLFFARYHGAHSSLGDSTHTFGIVGTGLPRSFARTCTQLSEASIRSGFVVGLGKCADYVTYGGSSATTPCWMTFRPSFDSCGAEGMIPSTSRCRGQQWHCTASAPSVRSGIIESPTSARRCTMHGNPFVGSLMDLSSRICPLAKRSDSPSLHGAVHATSGAIALQTCLRLRSRTWK
jgi:hypothetical protein